MFCKRRNWIIVVIPLVLFVLVGMIIDINNRFPNAKYMEYTKENPANVNGLQITPVGNRLYTMNELKKEYPSFRHYDEWDIKENDRFVVFEIDLKNTISDDIWFQSIQMEMFDTNSCCCNGVMEIEYKESIVMSSGEQETIHMIAYINSSALTQKQIDELDAKNMGLTLSYYPENKVLRFY